MTWRSGEPGSILVVDDDLTGRKAARRVLTRAGHKVFEAADIASAWSQLGQVDLAMIDVNLPDGSGLDFTRSLRTDPRFAGLAILQTSAVAVGPGAQAAGLDSGADAYLVHPTPPIVLASTIAALLRLRRAERALSESDRDLRAALDAGGVTVASIDFVAQTIAGTEGLFDLFGTGTGASLPLVALETSIHPADLGLVRNALRNLRQGLYEETEYRVGAPGRGWRRVLSRARPTLGENGAVVAAQVTLVDVTSRRALQDQLRAIEKMLDRASGALEFDDLAEIALPEIRAAWGVDDVAICLGRDDARIELCASGGHRTDGVPSAPLLLTEGLLYDVMTFGASMAAHLTDLSDEDRMFVGAGAVSAAAAPVVTADGRTVGVVVVSANTWHEFSAESLQLLAVLGARLGEPIRRVQAVAEQRALAVALQKQLLPQLVTIPPGLQLAARYVAGANHLDIGGDWYDCIELANDQVMLLVGDVTGKGASAAVVMSRIRAFTQALAGRVAGPAELFSALNQLLYRDDVADMATVCCVWLSADRDSARIALAGHPPPLLLVPGALVGSAKAGFLGAPPGLPLGAAPGSLYQETHTALDGDWTLLLYTDGLVERRDRSLDIGFAHLSHSALEAWSRNVDELADAVVDAGLGSIDRHDDVALLVVRRHRLASLQLVLPAQVNALAGLRRDLRRWAQSCALRLDVDDLILCVCEAVSNSIQHAYGLDAGTIQVSGSVEEDEATLTVRDSGRWRHRPSDGHGLRVIEALTKDHRIVRDHQGTEITMVFAANEAEQ